VIDIEQTILGALGMEGANRTTPTKVIRTMIESAVGNLVMNGVAAAASGGAGEIAKSAAKSVLEAFPWRRWFQGSWACSPGEAIPNQRRWQSTRHRRK